MCPVPGKVLSVSEAPSQQVSKGALTPRPLCGQGRRTQVEKESQWQDLGSDPALPRQGSRGKVAASPIVTSLVQGGHSGPSVHAV